MSERDLRSSNEELLAALRRWASESGLSQTELSERTGIAQSTLSRYISGRSRRMQSDTAERLRRRIPHRLLLEEHARAAAPSPRRRAPDERPVVFVSSTYLDNAERRGWVLEAIERAGMTPLAMERWTASPLSPRDLCVHRVGEADVFVGILAWRYGWTPEGEDKSITELEYDEAGRLGIPRLMFLIDQPLERVQVATEFDADDRWGKQVRLDAFKRRAREEQTALPFQDADLRTVVLQALYEWKERRSTDKPEWVPAQPSPFAPLERHEQDLADYLQAVEAANAHVVLPGFETRLRVPLLLQDLFVPVDLAPAEHVDEAAKETLTWKQATTDGASVDATIVRGGVLTLPDALGFAFADRRRRGLLVLGHPGSGKTTQLRRLALSFARGDLPIPGLVEDLVPVFVPLRRLTAQDRSLGDLVQRLVAHDDDLGFEGDFARWLWRRGRLLLLVDGLDEVAKERRAEVKDWIEKVARSPKRNLVVVTCRFEGYARQVRFGPEFLALSLRPLSDQQADTFVQRWYREVEVGILPPGSAERDRRAAERRAHREAGSLVERLRGPSMREARVYELAHNPLLLSAICLVHRDRAKLPERAEELYGSTLDVLLQHWREAKRLPVSFDARTARQILQPIALWLHGEEGRTQASEDELCGVLEPAMREAGWRDLTPRAFLATVRDESGLLTGWSAERFGFLHLGFQEYLAAHALYDGALRVAGDAQGFHREIDAIAARFGPSWWAEVLRLLLAIDHQGALFAPLFRAVLRHPRLPDHAELAGQCAGEARRFDPDPFRELLRLPAECGLWANRLVAAKILRSASTAQVSNEDLVPALKLLDREPGMDSALHEDQLAATHLVVLLSPQVARGRASKLAQHPHEGVRALAATLGPRTYPGQLIESVIFARPQPARVRLSGTLRVTPNSIREGSSGCELVLIPSGQFTMGSQDGARDGFSDELPAHEVKIAPFYMAVHPVTNEQYARFLAAHPEVAPPGSWGDRQYNQPRQPVVGVSWNDAQAYCRWAGLRLPTESEWEYACRAGSTTRFWSGDSEEDLARVGWYQGNSGGRLHSVGEKPASPFGLYDMHGNVWEWVQDAWTINYTTSMDAHPEAFEAEDAAADYRVVRGGSFAFSAKYAGSAYRRNGRLWHRGVLQGFRPAKDVVSD